MPVKGSLHSLKVVHPIAGLPTSAMPRVSVDFSLEHSSLVALFRVEALLVPYLNVGLSKDESQWGLWDWDVVELFLSCGGMRSHTPYYEFQVSPVGQFFELEIFEPRKRFNREFRSGFEHSVNKVGEGAFEIRMSIPLIPLGWIGDPATIFGNAFAILGAPEKRIYHGLFLEPQIKPDFHLPAEFKRLI
jgi:hypothetical protein